MKFNKRDVKDRVVQFPNRYTLKAPDGSNAGTYDLVPAPGTVSQEGTKINKAFQQPIEDWLADTPSSSPGYGAIPIAPNNMKDISDWHGVTFRASGAVSAGAAVYMDGNNGVKMAEVAYESDETVPVAKAAGSAASGFAMCGQGASDNCLFGYKVLSGPPRLDLRSFTVDGQTGVLTQRSSLSIGIPSTSPAFVSAHASGNRGCLFLIINNLLYYRTFNIIDNVMFSDGTGLVSMSLTNVQRYTVARRAVNTADFLLQVVTAAGTYFVKVDAHATGSPVIRYSSLYPSSTTSYDAAATETPPIAILDSEYAVAIVKAPNGTSHAVLINWAGNTLSISEDATMAISYANPIVTTVDGRVVVAEFRGMTAFTVITADSGTLSLWASTSHPSAKPYALKDLRHRYDTFAHFEAVNLDASTGTLSCTIYSFDTSEQWPNVLIGEVTTNILDAGTSVKLVSVMPNSPPTIYVAGSTATTYLYTADTSAVEPKIMGVALEASGNTPTGNACLVAIGPMRVKAVNLGSPNAGKKVYMAQGNSYQFAPKYPGSKAIGVVDFDGTLTYLGNPRFGGEA